MRMMSTASIVSKTAGIAADDTFDSSLLAVSKTVLFQFLIFSAVPAFIMFLGCYFLFARGMIEATSPYVINDGVQPRTRNIANC